MTNNLPSVGVHRGVDEREYHKWGGASNSRLSVLFDKSPAHLKAEIDNPSDPTPAMQVGTAVHAAILEPELFAAKVCCAPDVNKRTNAGKAELEAFELANVGRLILSSADFETVLRVRDAVNAHPSARNLLDNSDDRELSIAWDDAETGVRCKARLDIHSRRVAYAADVKTTSDASPKAFARTIANFGYHRQAAMYADGAAAVGLDVRDFVFIACEKTPPYAVAVYRLRDSDIELGRMQLRDLLRTFARCMDAGEWPGFDGGISEIALPTWATYE